MVDSDQDLIARVRIGRVVDLSRLVRSGMQVYPGDPEPRFTRIASIDADGFELSEVRIGSQSGTHVDAPSHILAGSATSHEIPVARCAAISRIVDCQAFGAGELIERPWLERQLASVEPGTGAILWTGWDRWDGHSAAWSHPALAPAAAMLLAEIQIAFVGIDAASVDLHQDRTLPSHQILAAAGMPIIENLASLGQVDWDEPLVVAEPVRLEALDGAPVRAVAIELVSSLRA